MISDLIWGHSIAISCNPPFDLRTNQTAYNKHEKCVCFLTFCYHLDFVKACVAATHTREDNFIHPHPSTAFPTHPTTSQFQPTW